MFSRSSIIDQRSSNSHFTQKSKTSC